MRRALMWLNLYGCETVQHQLKIMQKVIFLLIEDQSMKFLKKILRIGDFENLSFFEFAILIFLLYSHEKKSKFIG